MASAQFRTNCTFSILKLGMLHYDGSSFEPASQPVAGNVWKQNCTPFKTIRMTEAALAFVPSILVPSAGPGQERIYPCQTFLQGTPADTHSSALWAQHLPITSTSVFKALRSNSPTAAALMFMAISSSSQLGPQALPGALSYAKSYE